MLDQVRIEHFKSIKSLDFQAKRVNLFIGEPNTGKSNILEALGLFSVEYTPDLSNIVRFLNLRDLFHKYNVENAVKVSLNKRMFMFRLQNDKYQLSYLLLGDHYLDSHQAIQLEILSDGKLGARGDIDLARENLLHSHPKYYKFKSLKSFTGNNRPFLNPPYGENLPDILFYEADLRELIGELLQDKGFKLTINQGRKEIDIVEKEEKGISLSYPFSNMSDTLQRIIFYLSAIRSNKNSQLIFEEPESHIFPFYNKFLAELIGLDQDSGNQYFIATHNPYFLESIVEKTALSELSVFITYMDNYETQVKKLSDTELAELMSHSDVFFNLNKFLPN